LKTTKVIILPDMQYPQQDDRAINIAMQLVEYYRPDIIINLGDVVACDSISRYPKASWYDATVTLKMEMDIVNKGLDKQDKIFKRSGVKRKILLEGNHENRITRWLTNNAVQIGDIESLRIENLLRLNDRGYEYVLSRDQPIKMGKANILHGYFVNKYHAFKTISETGHNCLYGHTHDYQAYICSHLPDDPPRLAMSFGCLCKFDQSYIGKNPTRWVHGIGIMEFVPDGFFTAYFLPIVGYRCIFNNREFKV